MEDERYRLLREGYLDIKPPPDSPERILHKAWRRFWVRAIIFLPQGRGEPHLILQLCRKTQDDEPLRQVKASRDGLRLFRCRSGSRPLRCWGVASGSTLLLYLAAETEQLTQEWMHSLREGLWPSVSTKHECYYEVSLIDDEKSFSSGLLGVYGRLVKTSEMTLSIIHPHWQGTQMRWRLTDILDVRIIRRVKDEDSDSGVFSLKVRSSPTKDTRVLQFYGTTAIKTVEWLKSILPNVKKDEPKSKDTTNSETISHSETKTEKTNLLVPAEPTANYATIQKTKVIDNSQSTESTEDNAVASTVYGKVAEVPEKVLNIPDAFLNASTTSLMLEHLASTENGSHQVSDGESDDSTGSFDHIYEDLETVRDTRAFTLYEKVDDDDDDDEYVPHAPFEPPTLPERKEHKTDIAEVADDGKRKDQVNPTQKQNTKDLNNPPPAVDLRLARLCESVSEALKQAEESPSPAPVTAKRPNFLRKIVGKSKSKSHQASPSVEKAPSMMETKDTSTMKRTVSESDLTDTKLEDTDLPLRAFESGQVGNRSPIRHVQNEQKQKKQNHVPLEDLLKNMQVGDRQRHQHHRRGVSEGGKIVYEIDKHTKYLQVSNKNETITQSTTHSSDQQEAEYLDMT